MLTHYDELELLHSIVRNEVNEHCSIIILYL